MRKFLLLNLLGLLSITTSLAQITYTSISFPQANDVLSIATAVDSGLVVTPPSATATAWDFSTLVAINTFKDTIKPASSGPSAAMFPDADVLQPLLGNQGGTAYADVTSTKVERLGGGLEFAGISFVAPYGNTHITQVVPLTYNDAHSDTYQLNYGEHIDSIPFLRQVIDSLAGQLPGGGLVSPDSIRFSINGNENRLVDAWGTCQMTDSTYDVIRQKITTTYSIGIEVRIPSFLGAFWIDVSGFLPLPFPTAATIVNYNFLAEGVKQPIVSLTLDSAETFVTNIQFLDTIVNNPPTTIDVSYIQDELEVNIFPNPTRDIFTIQMTAGDVPTNGYDVHLVDMLGRIVMSNSAIRDDNYQMNVEGIANGHYVVVLRNQQGKILKREQVEILR